MTDRMERKPESDMPTSPSDIRQDKRGGKSFDTKSDLYNSLCSVMW